MKPFDLEAAKRGEPIVTRDGRKAKFVAHVPECDSLSRVYAFVEGDKAVNAYNEAGEYIPSGRALCDLFMAPRKRTVYVNIYRHSYARWHATEEIARQFAEYKSLAIAIPIEIEE